jgi:hypothetical protein
VEGASNEDLASICCGVSPEGRWREVRRVQRMGASVGIKGCNLPWVMTGEGVRGGAGAIWIMR